MKGRKKEGRRKSQTTSLPKENPPNPPCPRASLPLLHRRIIPRHLPPARDQRMRLPLITLPLPLLPSHTPTAPAQRPRNLRPHVAKHALGPGHKVRPVRQLAAAQVRRAVFAVRARNEPGGEGGRAPVAGLLLPLALRLDLRVPVVVHAAGSARGVVAAEEAVLFGRVFFEVEVFGGVAVEDDAFFGAVVGGVAAVGCGQVGVLLGKGRV